MKSALAVMIFLVGAATAQTVSGAGATFPYPIYAHWFDSYQNLHRGLEITYASVGSSEGIRRLIAGQVDFGASDGPMNDAQLAEAQAKLHTAIMHFPTVLGAAVPSYNIPGVRDTLRFAPEALSGIFLGTIKNWNDPLLVRDNPQVRLPPNSIVVVHRQDGSGTTYCWTDYLCKVSSEWQRRVGKGTTVAWPTGLAANGNDGVAGLIKQTPYSIGYLESTYARQNEIQVGSVKNSSGAFVAANLASIYAAGANAAKTMPDHFRVSITDAPGTAAYPIATFTWLLVPRQALNTAQRKALIGFLRWALTNGQLTVESLGYARLPKDIAAREMKALAALQ